MSAENVNGSGAQAKIYQVSEITRLIKSILEDEVGVVWVEGEVSNVRRPGSGHLYFTLKDASAQISAVMFRGSQRDLRCELRDGLLVRLFGEVTVYEKGGNYQILVRRIEEAGRGLLHRRFEELKAGLAAEGLFAAARKKPIPLLPRRVAVVTSPTGAAVRDILHVLSRRFPNLRVLIVPVRVQGEGAAAEIAAALDLVNAIEGADVIIAGRGGGSVEDLWAFNEEPVARAIARSRIPVISAVGHETDFTIADFVADLRAPTPSAAAEMVVGQKDAFEERMASLERRITAAVTQRVLRARSRLNAVAGSHVFREPSGVVRLVRQRIADWRRRQEYALAGRIREGRQALDDLATRQQRSVRLLLERRGRSLASASTHLSAMSPFAVLRRGYSVTTRADGRVLRSWRDAGEGQAVTTRLADGFIESVVRSARESAPARPGGGERHG